ncbi:hypothetical protein [Bacillus thuringiensis]|uniref:Uncharacterized protein n=1 Tax=Bacillus thuringiensis serovar yosoo TaxID=180848 RepID=A0A9X6FDG9_BACTU|nr:hypothetical protein [Bacillus thuringiensis]OTY60380.1 hypothetical protein BK746_08190 [Bacillus thuringiensis serovar yosoo]
MSNKQNEQNSQNIKITNEIEGVLPMTKSIEQALKDQGYKVRMQYHDLPRGVSYKFDDEFGNERISSYALWDTQHRNTILRTTMQLNSLMKKSKL